MDRQIKKVAMTGGSGPVGLALIQKLLSENIEILLFQRKDSLRKQNLPQSELLHIQYCPLEEIKHFDPKEKDYDVFFHLGWANTKRNMRDNIEEQNKNVIYSCDTVEAARKLGCHTFIGVGSQAEYGRQNQPLRGDMLCEPETAYGVMKLCACYATRILCGRYHMSHIWTRVLSGYGLYDNTDSMLISNILNSLKGKPLMFSAAEQVWDFIYIDDVANALWSIAKKGKDNEIYPIGSGDARPLKEYIQILCQKLGENMQTGLGQVPYSEKQVMYLDADIAKLKEDTGWAPMIPFEEGIQRVISFYRKYGD